MKGREMNVKEQRASRRWEELSATDATYPAQRATVTQNSAWIATAGFESVLQSSLKISAANSLAAFIGLHKENPRVF
jgi:hypothetical protein